MYQCVKSWKANPGWPNSFRTLADGTRGLPLKLLSRERWKKTLAMALLRGGPSQSSSSK